MRIVEVLKRRKRRCCKSLVLALSVSLLTSLASSMGYLEAFEAKALDLLLWARGRIQSPEIVLVHIDDQAFRNLEEKQPLPRSYLASLIEVLAKSGAKVIAMDIEFKVKTDPQEDALLLRAMQSASENGITKVVPVFVIRPVREEDGRVLYSRTAFFSPDLTPLAGFANAPIDPDGFVRQLPVAVRGADGRVLPSLALAVLARYAGYDNARLDAALNQAEEISLLLPEWDKFAGRLRPQPTPLSFQLDNIWKINFTGAQGSFTAIPSDPVAFLAKQDFPVAADNPFRGKIVLVGATFGDSRDFFPTPQGLMSGVEIHANIIHTLLSRSQILPAHRFVALWLSLLFALVISLLLSLFRPVTVTILGLLAIPLVLIPLSYLAFARLGLWVDFVTPLLAIWLGGLVGDLLERKHLRRSLGQYVDREVADQIVHQDESLSGRRLNVSVFFTDIRNYTTLCEGSPPERVVGILNELFEMMAGAISSHHGMISDFIGDAVMAVFGAPKTNPRHARDAVETALEVQAGLMRLNEKWQSRGYQPIRIGVGIHTGEVVAGIVGSEGRKKFACTGDTVNTGSRVEGLNKEFSTDILISRETLESIDGEFAVRACGQARVKGRDKPVEVFEVLGRKTAP
ncbi:MAG: adenylate/guanylate cyclase domain-containing protein [candidate division NC10 bacterium]|nr:adenylate/guanylate cyclase domain-containing protein [candidate division NC10 bacterium]